MMFLLSGRRFAGLLALLVMIGIAGCGSQPSGKTPPPVLNVKVAEPINGGPVTPGKELGAGNRPTATEFIGSFLKAIHEGKADAELLSLDFRKKIARPRPTRESDQKIGYNPDAVDAFLKKASHGINENGYILGSTLGTDVFYAGNYKVGEQSEPFLICVTQADVPAGWLISWFHRTPANGSNYRAIDGSTFGPTLAAYRFLDTLLAGDYGLAEASLGKAFKADKAFSKAASDADDGYSWEMLHKFRLPEWRKNFTNYAISQRDFPAGKAAVFEGDLITSAKETRKFILHADKNDKGEWIVTDFEVK